MIPRDENLQDRSFALEFEPQGYGAIPQMLLHARAYERTHGGERYIAQAIGKHDVDATALFTGLFPETWNMSTSLTDATRPKCS